jgi:phage terminase small subunit
MTPKQQAFCREYLVDKCGSKAAVRAGYAPKQAKKTACDLLKRPEIRKAVTREAMQQSQAERTRMITQDRRAAGGGPHRLPRSAQGWSVTHGDARALAIRARRRAPRPALQGLDITERARARRGSAAGPKMRLTIAEDEAGGPLSRRPAPGHAPARGDAERQVLSSSPAACRSSLKDYAGRKRNAGDRPSCILPPRARRCAR